MTNTLMKGLELGLAFALFVAGLSTLFLMGQHMSDYIQLTREANADEHHYSLVASVDGDYLMSKEEIYYMVLESSLDVISIDGLDVMTLKKRGRETPGASVHQLMLELDADMRFVVEGYFEEVLVIDDKGKVESIDYRRK